MPRMAPIRRCFAPIHEPISKDGLYGVRTTIIHIDCMHNCGEKIRVVVDTLDIVPHLGRPRGLYLRCHKCSLKFNNNGMIKYSERLSI